MTDSTEKAGGPFDRTQKTHVEVLEELLEEVKGLRQHMHTVSEYVEGLTTKIEQVLEDDPTDEAGGPDHMEEPHREAHME